MSCWVVPTIAAEIWGMPLDQLMARIGKGQVPTKLEQGFMFVDVAPDGPRYEPLRLRPEERPATYTVVSDEELAALQTDDVTDPGYREEVVAELVDEALDVVFDEDDLDHEAEDDASVPLEEPEPAVQRGDWRVVRQQTARLRTPPPRISTAA